MALANLFLKVVGMTPAHRVFLDDYFKPSLTKIQDAPISSRVLEFRAFYG